MVSVNFIQWLVCKQKIILQPYLIYKFSKKYKLCLKKY